MATRGGDEQASDRKGAESSGSHVRGIGQSRLSCFRYEVSGACGGMVRELCEERPQKHYIRENAPAHAPCLSCDMASAYRQDHSKAFAGLCELSCQRRCKRKDRQATRTEVYPPQSQLHLGRFQLRGFRRSEMFGLEWKDIDFENNIISVMRTSNYTSERGIYTDTTKTKRSKRVLKISPYIMGILKELKDEQDEEALRLGHKWVESDRLFVKWNGEPMNNQTPYGCLKEFCEKNDMPFYGIHSLGTSQLRF